MTLLTYTIRRSLKIRNVQNVFGYSTSPKPASIDPIEDSKMIAWQIHSYGELEELRLSKNAKIPKIRDPDHVLVEVLASSVNPIDVAMLGGYGSTMLNTLRQIEMCSLSPPIEFPLTLGRDFSGRVIGKGLGVGSKLNVGDEVWGVIPPHKQGCHAQRVVVNKSLVSKRPSQLTPVEAGSMLYTGMTAWSALKISGDLLVLPARGKRVLVLGGSGGVGAMAIQLLKAWGAQVVSTCRTDATPLLESLGADCVIDYTLPEAEKLVKEEGKYDIILDAAGIGSESRPNYIGHLKDFNLSKFITLKTPLLRNVDSLGLMGGMAKNAVDLLIPNVRALFTSASSTIRWAFFAPLPSAIDEISSLVQQGKICPSVEKVFSFSDVPAAYERVKNGHLRGKIVIDMENKGELEEPSVKG